MGVNKNGGEAKEEPKWNDNDEGVNGEDESEDESDSDSDDGESDEDDDYAMMREEDPSWSDKDEEKGERKKKKRRKRKHSDEDNPGSAKRQRDTSTAPALPRHKRNIIHKNGKRVYHCEECSRDFNQPRSFDKHRETHHMYGTFSCELCSEFHCRFANELYNHVTLEHRVEFKCPVSGVSFGAGREAEFSSHYKRCYREREREERKAKVKVKVAGPDEEKKKPHMCDLCGEFIFHLIFLRNSIFISHRCQQTVQ